MGPRPGRPPFDGPVMITRASFRNFKSLREVDVTFDSRLTVLVGPNGSGKSSVLEGIHAMGQVARAAVAGSIPNPRHLIRYLSRGASPERFLIRVEEGSDGGHPHRATVTGTASGPGEEPQLRFTVTGPRPAASPVCPPTPHGELFPALRTSVLVRHDPRRLAEPSRADGFPPALEADGSNLPSVLSHLESYHVEALRQVDAAIRQLVPAVVGVRTVYDRQADKDCLLLNFNGADEVPATLASTGTLLALGLLTALHHPNRPSVLLCDDLDSGLHPKAQMELVDVLRGLLDRQPDLQIIATSHSPYILDRLEWNEVRVTSLDDGGAAVCRPLDEHPQYARWHDAMSPGEFWSHTGEDWVRKLTNTEAVPGGS